MEQINIRNESYTSCLSGSWFQTFFMFTPTWGRFPFWLIFSNGLKPPTSYSMIHRTFSFSNLRRPQATDLLFEGPETRRFTSKTLLIRWRFVDVARRIALELPWSSMIYEIYDPDIDSYHLSLLWYIMMCLCKPIQTMKQMADGGSTWPCVCLFKAMEINHSEGNEAERSFGSRC